MSDDPTEAMELAGMRALRSLPRTVSGEASREQARACWEAMRAAAKDWERTSTAQQVAENLAGAAQRGEVVQLLAFTRDAAGNERGWCAGVPLSAVPAAMDACAKVMDKA